MTLIVYYRIYAGDGAIPSNTPAAPGDPFLGRIKALSVPPPYRDTASAVKRTIAKAENIDDRASNMLFLIPYSSKLPMDDADKVTILNCASLRSTQQPLAFVANISDSDSERRRSGLAEPDSKTPSEIQYCTFIQDRPTFLFILIFRLLGGSVLSALRRRFRDPIESSH